MCLILSRFWRYIYNLLHVLFMIGMQDAEELGVIFIGTESNSYSVAAFAPKSTRGNKWKHGIMVDTPARQFVLMCEQEKEQREWIDALRKIQSRPMSPQDYTGKPLELWSLIDT